MAGDRKFYMQSGSTYIETQKNYIRGNQIIGDRKDMEQEVVDADNEMSDDQKPTTIEQLDAAFVLTINAMVQNGDIKYKQDFGVIKKIINEKCIYEKFTHENLLERLDKCNVPGNLKPTLSSLKVLSFGTAPHPNWKITGVDPDETKRLCTLAEDFIDIFNTFK